MIMLITFIEKMQLNNSTAASMVLRVPRTIPYKIKN